MISPSLRQQRAERKEIALWAILARSQPAGQGLRGWVRAGKSMGYWGEYMFFES